MCVPPNGGPPPHRHDFEEMFTLVEGELEFTFRGEKVRVRAGRTVNIPADAPRFFRNVSAEPARMMCMCTPAGQEDCFWRSAIWSTAPTARRRGAPRPGNWCAGERRSSRRRAAARRSCEASDVSTGVGRPRAAPIAGCARDRRHRLCVPGPLPPGRVVDQAGSYQNMSARFVYWAAWASYTV
ncbi:hypothetical protein ABIA38_009076 [Embleya sp. AB8]